MALPNSSGSSGADKPNPSLIDLGTFFVDSDIIFGFTSHLLRRKAKVEGCPSGESPFPLDLNSRKILHSSEYARCNSRPPPEGAGSVTVSESERRDGKGSFCQQCQINVTELKRQALALADPSSLKCLYALGHWLSVNLKELRVAAASRQYSWTGRETVAAVL
ncbi:unnamed protein product [Coregonus sp. 'balchen']|nr:unnamed protein product [Coregonus sp. 'balchen']